MDSRYLHAFVAVAETGGISAAADRLGYAQSSLSAQLRRLESELGTTVVDRTSTGAPLTEAGRRLLPYAREALDLDERMRRAAAAEVRPRLRIGALETLASEWLPDIVTALHHGAGGAEGCAAEVSIAVGNRAHLNEDLVAGRIDLLFLFENGSTTPNPHAVVGHEPVILVTGPSHPLAGRHGITDEDLLGSDFLIAEPGCTSHMIFDRYGEDLMAQAHIAMITGSFGALRRLAAHGRGVALLPRLAIARELREGDLVALDLVTPPRPVAIEARWRTGHDDAALASVLRIAGRHTREAYEAAAG